MISPKTYFLTEDRSKVVAEDNPKAKFLLVRAGMEIDDKTAARHGLTADGLVDGDEDDAGEDENEDHKAEGKGGRKGKKAGK